MEPLVTILDGFDGSTHSGPFAERRRFTAICGQKRSPTGRNPSRPPVRQLALPGYFYAKTRKTAVPPCPSLTASKCVPCGEFSVSVSMT